MAGAATPALQDDEFEERFGVEEGGEAIFG